jgi:hypothetical protein
LSPALRGCLPTTGAHVGKRAHIDFTPSGLVRLISQPPAVRGQVCEDLIERGLEQVLDLAIDIDRDSLNIPGWTRPSEEQFVSVAWYTSPIPPAPMRAVIS